MHKGIFITGTDTGVGKTFVAVGLITALRKMGFKICPMKPVETGCRTLNGRLVPTDALKLIRAARVDEPINLINPHRFRRPLAPAVAAELDGTAIRKKRICSAFGKLSNKYDIVIVEGAGGIMVPLYKKYLSLDLIKDLDLPILIVSRPGLGTINHTLLTIEVARKGEIDITGVIIDHAVNMKRDTSEKTNPCVIEELTGVPVLGIVPYMKNLQMKTFKHISEKILSRL